MLCGCKCRGCPHGVERASSRRPAADHREDSRRVEGAGALPDFRQVFGVKLPALFAEGGEQVLDFRRVQLAAAKFC
jgi:hypothetical protein